MALFARNACTTKATRARRSLPARLDGFFHFCCRKTSRMIQMLPERSCERLSHLQEIKLAELDARN